LPRVRRSRRAPTQQQTAHRPNCLPEIEREIAIASSLASRSPPRILVDKETVIRLGHLVIDFSQLRVGDWVAVTLRPVISGDTVVYRAQLIEVTRLPGPSTASR
jgi:hypothetical protein